MICGNPNCHCQSEIGVLRDGRHVCSDHCDADRGIRTDICSCNHVGCEPIGEMGFAQAESLPA